MADKKEAGRFKIWAKWIIGFLVIQFCLINLTAALHAWKFTHFYTDPSIRTISPYSKNIFRKTWKLFTGMKFPRSLPPQAPSYPIDTVLLKTKTGLTINCWYAIPDSSAKGTIILFHGLTGNKNIYSREATWFRDMGYQLLMVDFRGHGSSSGNKTSIGFYEAEEVKLAYDYIKERGESNIFLWGISMGAIAIIKAIHDYPEINPAGIMTDMPFASLQYHTKARSRIMGFPEEPFGFLVAGWIGIEQGFNGYKFNVAEYAKKIHCPVLLSWGTHDKLVQKEETELVYNNIPGNNKSLVIYEGADHQSFLGYDPVLWKKVVLPFLKKPTALRPE